MKGGPDLFEDTYTQTLCVRDVLFFSNGPSLFWGSWPQRTRQEISRALSLSLWRCSRQRGSPKRRGWKEVFRFRTNATGLLKEKTCYATNDGSDEISVLRSLYEFRIFCVVLYRIKCLLSSTFGYI